MKNILLFLALSTTVLFTSCEGDPGPPGQDGGLYFAQVFEANVDFQYNAGSNTYSTSFVSYPFEVFESDVVLVYRYEGTVDSFDVWTQLPQNIFYQDGTGDIFQYNFNHTFVDVQFTIEGNFDLTTIGSEFVNDQIFRIAVVPAEFAKTNPTMEQILQMKQVDGSNVKVIEL